MMNVGTQHFAAMNRIKTISLGEKVLHCSLLSPSWRRCRPILPTKLSRAWLFEPVRAVGESLASTLDRHGRLKIGKMIKSPGAPNGEPARGIEAPEIYPGNTLVRHVRPDVEFRKGAQAWHRWRSAKTNVTHPEWNYPDPGRAVAQIQIELLWNQVTNAVPGHRPVRE